jgi:hypothetical protein
MKCKNCTNWKPEQAELDYSIFYGICTCNNWKFTTTIESDVRILDRQNLSQKHMRVHHFESQSNQVPFGAVTQSRYCLVTKGNFGCINFNKNE